MGLIVPSFQRSEIATVKITPECYFVVVKSYSENNNRRLFGEINLFQMLHRTYYHGGDKKHYTYFSYIGTVHPGKDDRNLGGGVGGVSI